MMKRSKPWVSDDTFVPTVARIHVSESDYHGTPYSQYMTSHKLATFADDPAIYDLAARGLLPREEKPEWVVGSAFHCYFLEPALFAQKYVVGDGPINPKTDRPYGRDTNKWRDFEAELSVAGLTFISTEEAQSFAAMRESIYNHDTAARMFLCGTPEVTLRGELHGVECQSRLDWVCDKAKVIVDLKTCDSLDRLARLIRNKDAEGFSYIAQLAFYRKMIEAETGEEYRVRIVAVEKSYPYRVGVWLILSDTLFGFSQWIDSTLGQFRHCKETNKWPPKYAEPIPA